VKDRVTAASNRGTSLVEALVALAVMAFGMLAVVGIQATLRSNADVAKQRSEAARIAQDAMETARSFSSIEVNGALAAYAGIAARGEAVLGSNTSFALTQVVTPRTNPDRKELRISVAWTDRSGQDQQVELNGIIGANDPLVSLALGAQAKGIPVRQPHGRNAAIPPQAVSLGGGTSAFRPAPTDPMRASRVLLIDDMTGVITSICTFPPDGDLSQLEPAVNCDARPSYLISGFVRFALGDAPDAAAPADFQIPLGMVADGFAYGDGRCYVDAVRAPPLTYSTYYCRVPMGDDEKWTGRISLTLPLDLAAHDVCRYTNGAAGNDNHPRDYELLDRSLASQNFLVVKQGVACPAGTTAHQPPP
jgi:Tfp pilus assembly protein PilV